ncbi:hypothetical protein CC79DRAFT_924394 [Sarocladium strictum]
MTDSGSRFGSEPGRKGRPRAKTNSAAPTYTAVATSLDSFPPTTDGFSRQRSHSSVNPAIPTITVSTDDNVHPLIQSLNGYLPSRGRFLGGANQPADSDDHHAFRPKTPQSSAARLGIGLGLTEGFSGSAQQLPELYEIPPQPPHVRRNFNVIEWNQQTQMAPEFLAFTSYSDRYTTHSPASSPMPSPLLSSSSFDSPGASPFLDQRHLSFQWPSSAHTDIGIVSGLPEVQGPLDVAGLQENTLRPSLTVATQGLGTYGSLNGSDGFSGSTTEWSDSALPRTPLDYTSSSQATSPMPSNYESGFQELPYAGQYLNSEAIIDDTQLQGFNSEVQLPQQPHQRESSDDTTPTSIAPLPSFGTSTHLLHPPEGQNHHHRRESDPSPFKSNNQVLDGNARVSRSRSVVGSLRNRLPERSRSTNKRTNLLSPDLSLAGEDSQLPLRPSTPANSNKGRRQGPMSEEGRSGATDRRTMKDTCISCKSAKVKCTPSPGSWDVCEKCDNTGSQLKPNVAQLCGKYCFLFKVQACSLDYSTIFWITPYRTSSRSPSRLFVPMPASLNLSQLKENFSFAIRVSSPLIRVSCKSNRLYDISLGGAVKYLSNERNAPLTSQKNWPSLIQNLSETFDDGWLDCLSAGSQLRTLDDILEVLPAWTTQQGCFDYSFVSADGLSTQQLNPDNLLEKKIIISAAQVSRIITRKVEKLGFQHLQKIIPGDKWKPSSANPPNINLTRTLGLVALSLRLRYHVWARHGVPKITTPMTSLAHSNCVEAVRWVCRSMYSNHCWLQRWVVPELPASAATPSTEVSISLYAGSSNFVTELMSRGEHHDGFLEWWEEGQSIVRQAGMEPVVYGGEEVGTTDALMSGMGSCF